MKMTNKITPPCPNRGGYECIDILFIKQRAEVEEYLLADLRGIKGVTVATASKTLIGKFLVGNRSPIAKLLKRMPLYEKICDHFFVYNIDKYIKRAKKDTVIIIQAQVLNMLPYRYFKERAVKKNLKLCLWIIDSVHASSPTFLSVLPEIFNNKWDAIYTYDDFDAKEFNWQSIQKCYFSISKYHKPRLKRQPVYDVYFTGGMKGNKEKTVFPLYDFLKSSGVSALFSLYCYTQEQFDEWAQSYPGISFYRKWRSYKKIIKETLHARCIIEILQEGQKSQSIRYFEALLFNKKLLTNNPDIKRLPYYNPDYMRYFNDINDIDIEWLKKDVKIDWGYKNDFSPIKFIEMVRTDFAF